MLTATSWHVSTYAPVINSRYLPQSLEKGKELSDILAMGSKSLLSRGLNAVECMAAQPRVTIDIDGQYPGDSKVYTTFDQVEGTVTIEVGHETPFHDIGITLEGMLRLSSLSTEQGVDELYAKVNLGSPSRE